MAQLAMLVLPASIILTVFGFGLQTTLADVLSLTRRPSLLLRSLLAMFVIMPIFTLGLVRWLELRPSVEIALMALAISPVPPLLPGRERKAGGRGDYALGLMVVMSSLAIFTLPLWLHILGILFDRPLAMSLFAIARTVVLISLLPLLAGIIVRAFAPGLADKLAKPVSALANVLLAGGALVLLVHAAPTMLAMIGSGTVVALAAFVAAGLAIGHTLAAPIPEEQVVLAFSTACRHPAIALAVARANFPDEPNLGASILLYLLIGLIVGLPYIARVRKLTTTAVPAA